MLVLMVFLLGYFILRFIQSKQDNSLLETYSNETLNYIQINKSGIKTVFDKMFDEAENCSTNECFQTVYSQILNTIPKPEFDFILVRYRPNSSAGGLQSLESTGTGGYGTDLDINPDAAPFVDLLTGKNDKSFIWDDIYFYGYGKVVVVPVQIDGKIIGAIVRPLGIKFTYIGPHTINF